MEAVNDFFSDKRQHYHYLEQLFKKASKVFTQLAEMVTDLGEVFDALENECVIKRSKCVFRKRRANQRFERKKALPFAMFVKDSIDKCRKEHPKNDLVDCINILKTYWDDPKYRSIREMYEYLASEEGGK